MISPSSRAALTLTSGTLTATHTVTHSATSSQTLSTLSPTDMTTSMTGKSSASSFCIDALLAREDHILKSPPSTSSLSCSSRGSPAMSADDARSSSSPLSSPALINGGIHSSSRGTPADSEHIRSGGSPPVSPLWSPRSNNLQMCSPLGSHSHHNNSGAMQSLFSSANPSPHPLYAAMYSQTHGPHNMTNGPNCPPHGIPMIHSSAFHSPFHDLKGHSASSAPGLPIDWLTRAGLLYHRTSGKW